MAEDDFGGAIAMDDNLLLAGALVENDPKGSAYIFNMNKKPPLTITCTCPGTSFIDVICATPGSDVAIIFGTLKRQYTLTGNTCPGTTILVHPSKFLPGSPFIHVANGEGKITFQGNVPQAVCDRIYIQAVDLTTCNTSNVVRF